MTWTDQRACHDTNTDVFFPTRGQPVTPALNICNRCPVTQPCLELALAADGDCDKGIFGGTTAKRRRQIRHDLYTKRQAAS